MSFFLQLDTQCVIKYEISKCLFTCAFTKDLKIIFSRTVVSENVYVLNTLLITLYTEKKLSRVVSLLGNNICMTKNKNASKAAFSFPQMRN
jgi:hypothetical protein